MTTSSGFPTSTATVQDVERFVNEAYAGMLDLRGKPKVEHLYAVAKGAQSAEEYIASLLHDFIEDFELKDLERQGIEDPEIIEQRIAMRLQELLEFGCSKLVCRVVDIMTKRPWEKRYLEDYVSRICRIDPEFPDQELERAAKKMARPLKLRDVNHNNSEERLATLPLEKAVGQLTKRAGAPQMLQAAIDLDDLEERGVGISGSSGNDPLLREHSMGPKPRIEKAS